MKATSSELAAKAGSSTVTPDSIKGAIQVVAAIGAAIEEAREIPSGTLYGATMGYFEDLAAYEKCLLVLKNAGLVEETPGHLLRWVGPAITPG